MERMKNFLERDVLGCLGHLNMTNVLSRLYWIRCYPLSLGEALRSGHVFIWKGWPLKDAPLATVVRYFYLLYWPSCGLSLVWLSIVFLPNLTVYHDLILTKGWGGGICHPWFAFPASPGSSEDSDYGSESSSFPLPGQRTLGRQLAWCVLTLWVSLTLESCVWFLSPPSSMSSTTPFL